MTTKSHYYFGLYLLSAGLNCTNKIERDAFVYGCMEPDFNPTTYFKGSFHQQKLRGHNFRNMLPCIEKLFEKIEQHQPAGALYFYRFGKMTHYLIDAFTYPHNAEFEGSLRDHVAYEAMMQKEFINNILECQPLSQPETLENSYEMFLKAHKEYIEGDMGKERDIYFAGHVIPYIVCNVYANSILASKQEVLYENLTNI